MDDVERHQRIFRGAWNDAIEAAAQVADSWNHHGDPVRAMYAAPRIRDLILQLKCMDNQPAPVPTGDNRS